MSQLNLAGRARRTLVVQLSDTHIRAPGEYAYGQVDTAAYLRQAIDTILHLPQVPDAVLITGDLSDDGSAASYAHLAQLLAPLPMPVYLLAGNHDDVGWLRQAFPHHPWLAGSGTLDYAVNIGPLCLLVLDTHLPGQEHGQLHPAQLQWLAKQLAQHRQQPVIVAMHHPPFATLIDAMDAIGLRQGGAALAHLLHQHPQVERLLCGHLHRAIEQRFGGTLASTAPATAHQVACHLSPQAPLAWTLEPPALRLHVCQDNGPVVSHLLPIGPFAGPFLFNGVG